MRVESDSAESGRKPRRIRAWAVVAGLLVLALAGFWFSAIVSASRQEVWFTTDRIPGIGKRLRMLRPADWDADFKIVGEQMVYVAAVSQMVYVAAPAPRLRWLRIPVARKLLKLDEVEAAEMGVIHNWSTNPEPVPPGTSGIGLYEGPDYRDGMVNIRHGKHWVSVYYRRSDKKEFERTYRKILNSAKLVD